MTEVLRSKLGIASLVAFGLTSATSAHAFTGTINSSATIVNPITVSQGAPLDFGSISTSASAGTVAIPANATGTATAGGGVALVGGSGGRTAGKINLSASGSDGLNYGISVPATVTLSGPGAPMSANLSLDSNGGSLGVGGTATHYVGATLAVGAGQTAGTYSGTFNVTVDYQ